MDNEKLNILLENFVKALRDAKPTAVGHAAHPAGIVAFKIDGIAALELATFVENAMQNNLTLRFEDISYAVKAQKALEDSLVMAIANSALTQVEAPVDVVGEMLVQYALGNLDMKEVIESINQTETSDDKMNEKDMHQTVVI